MVSGVADSPFPPVNPAEPGMTTWILPGFRCALSGFVKCSELRRAEVLEGRLIEIHFAI